MDSDNIDVMTTRAANALSTGLSSENIRKMFLKEEISLNKIDAALGRATQVRHTVFSE